jgi:hypothetical protein
MHVVSSLSEEERGLWVGGVSVCETIGTTSMLRLIHRSVEIGRMFPTSDLNWE